MERAEGSLLMARRSLGSTLQPSAISHSLYALVFPPFAPIKTGRWDMGPTKAIAKENTLHEAVSGKLIKDGFASRRELEDYVNRHYLALPVADRAGKVWLLDGKPVYCFRGSPYETVDDQKAQPAPC